MDLNSVGIPGGESAGLSYDLWRNCPRARIMLDPNAGYFVRMNNAATPEYATTVGQAGWYPFIGSSATIRGTSTIRGGAMRFSLPATDNIEAALQAGGATTGAAFTLSTATPKELWLETRVAVGQLAETGAFFGLGKPGLAATDTLVDNTGELADAGMIGFHCPMHASAAVFSAVYRKEGETAVTMKSAIHTAVAAAFVNLGFYYNVAEGKLELYCNGVRSLKYTLSTATNFPVDVFMSPLIYAKAGEASAKTLDVASFECFAVR
jgi:hypothetical protein